MLYQNKILTTGEIFGGSTTQIRLTFNINLSSILPCPHPCRFPPLMTRFLVPAGDRCCAGNNTQQKAQRVVPGYFPLTSTSGSYDLDGATTSTDWGNFYLHCDAFLQFIDMTDDADPSAGRLKLLDHRHCHCQTVAVERAETLVDEQAFTLDPTGVWSLMALSMSFGYDSPPNKCVLPHQTRYPSPVRRRANHSAQSLSSVA